MINAFWKGFMYIIVANDKMTDNIVHIIYSRDLRVK